MPVQLLNNASSTLASAISDTDVELSLASGGGANFPSITSPDFFYITVVGTAGNLEIMKVTTRAGDVLSITRAQDSTSASAFSAGSLVEMRINVASITDYVDNQLRDAETITYTAPLTGAVETNVEARLSDRVSVKDFGITEGAGQSEAVRRANVTAWDNFVAACAQDGVYAGIIPSGTFETIGQLTTTSNIRIVASPGAIIAPQPDPTFTGDDVGMSTTSGSIITNVTGGPTYTDAIQSNVTIENLTIDCAAVVGENAYGFARGASNFKMVRCRALNLTGRTAGGTGAKGFIFEMGVQDSHVVGGYVKSAYTGYEAQGLEGTLSNGFHSGARGCTFEGHAEDCDVALQLKTGTSVSEEITNDPEIFSGSFDIRYKNCGHLNTLLRERPATLGWREKGAPLVLVDASNWAGNIIGHNESTYPASYNTFASGYSDGGLSGSVGSVIQGWGRNLTVNAVHTGDVDTATRVRRTYSVADAGATSGSATIASIDNSYISVEVKGTVQVLLASELRDDQLSGTAAAYNSGTLQLTLDGNASTLEGDYVGRDIDIVGGTGSGESAIITAYSGVTRVATLDAAPATVWDATSQYSIQGSSLSLDPTDVSGRWDLTANTITQKFIDYSAGDFEGAMVTCGTSDGKRVNSSTPFFVYNSINSPLTRTPQSTTMAVNTASTEVLSVADDDVAIVELPGTYGLFILNSDIPDRAGMFWFRGVAGSDRISFLTDDTPSGVSRVATTTGVLSGTTGADGMVTLSVDTAGSSKKLYIENRAGLTIGVVLTFASCID